MKGQTLIKASARQFGKICRGNGRRFGEKLHVDIAMWGTNRGRGEMNAVGDLGRGRRLG